MSIDWNQLLLDATDDTKASQIPVCEDLTAEVAFGSQHGPLQNSTLKSPDLNFVDVAYPSVGGVPSLSDSEVISQSVLVGLHLQMDRFAHARRVHRRMFYHGNVTVTDEHALKSPEIEHIAMVSPRTATPRSGVRIRGSCVAAPALR